MLKRKAKEINFIMIYNYIFAIFLLYACSFEWVECQFFESLFSNAFFKDWNRGENLFDNDFFKNSLFNRNGLQNFQPKNDEKVLGTKNSQSLFSNDYFKDWYQRAFDKEFFKNIFDRQTSQLNSNLLQNSQLKNEKNENNQSFYGEQDNLDSGCKCDNFICKCCTKFHVNQLSSDGFYD